MIEPAAAVAATVGVLAVFGVSMVGLDMLARSGARWARPLGQRHAPTVYTAILLAAAALFLVLGFVDPVAVVLPDAPAWLVPMLLAAPFVAVVWYLIELTVASAQVRAGGLLTPTDARDVVSDIASSPGLWWVLAVCCALGEELIFRGMLQTSVAEQWGQSAAIPLGAALFGLHHVSFGVPSMVSKSAGGALMGVQTAMTGSIVPAVVAHLCFQGLVYRRERRMSARRHHAA